ncbi:stabilizer of axonemal microtubules 4 isoform X2 [Meriones unguiculatus]|uniref:stabilizer of axonemal microtubules 4 isoform X2 n=1 Tax=Meriones unguiculatus TaxID=10047 RepID=UPI00293EBABD|nr:stabilizer of axonemal microtubules 4 isoform X2 [Meriones unguiculatus]
MMGKLPLGVVSPYVKMSSGGCSDPLKFYATSYCTAYGREEFKPRMGCHVGTGYKSNYRPMIYKPHLDSLDNPATGEQIHDTSKSVASQSYCPLEGPDSKQPLPRNLYQTTSGYAREKFNTGPLSKEVRKVHFDTQDHGPQTITGLEPKEVPLLHQQQGKGSMEWENSHYGPRFMSSEYNSKYIKETPNHPDPLLKKTIGVREESGFTEETSKNPIVFQPPSQALAGEPVLHPGRSVTKSDYLPINHPQGNEFLPVLTRGSDRDTGYSRVNERTLSSRMPAPSPQSATMSHRSYQPPQRMQQTNVALLGRESIGNKEPTGFTLNNPSYFRSSFDPDRDQRYLTTYNQGYFDNTPKGLEREGWTRGGIQPQKPGGYALSESINRMENTPDPAETLRHLHPHVGRTLTSLDPFYQTHNNR